MLAGVHLQSPWLNPSGLKLKNKLPESDTEMNEHFETASLSLPQGQRAEMTEHFPPVFETAFAQAITLLCLTM